VRFAERTDQLPRFLFAELMRRIEEKRRAGVDVIALGSADPDLPTCEAVVHAATAALTRPVNHRYPTVRGTPAFRQAVAQFMSSRFGVLLDPDSEIMPALGGKEALHHLGLATLEPGTICLAPDPGYPVYASAPVLAGAGRYPLPLTRERGFLPDLSAVPADIAARARLLFLNYPNNPTGAVATEAFFAEVVRFAKRTGVIVVHDNAYSEIAFDGCSPPSFIAVPGAREVGVEVFSLSKGWNMTGWRAAFVAGNSTIIARLAHLKPHVDTGMFGAIQEAVIAALTQAPDFPRQMSAVYERRRDLMLAALGEAGLPAEAPRATPFLWLPIPAGMSSSSLADSILDQTGVVVSPGSSFGDSGEGYIRISLTAADERLAEAAARIRKQLRLAPAVLGAR
jgi:LL-diaminopimelate aminotransferase